MAVAPSLSGEELPAVTEPPSANAGRSFASISSDVSARGPSGGARLELARGRDGRLHAGSAQAVHGLAGHLDRETRKQQGHPRDVAVVLARLVGAAEDDVVDVSGIHAGAPHRLRDGDRGQVVWPHI